MVDHYSFALMQVGKPKINEKVFLQGLDAVTSCYPLSLCLSVLLSAAALRTLVVLGIQLLWASELFKKGKWKKIFDDVKWMLT
jgi:hypothetical protein